uniref:B cell scaffold protein with ankyrin repeats 1 n=1 Tax=Scleropages formosus TaxID=113540 RepID=A0A8C9T8Z9_SCLFO
MSATVEDLLIIYEEEAKQWASYLKSIFAGLLPTAGILCYDISTVTSNLDESLNLGHYRCKLLVLSQGMLEGLCQIQRFFLARVLQPSAQVVVLLCGVETIDPLLQTVPAIEGCLQLSSEQDAQVYLSTVTEIMQKGSQAVIPAERKQPARAPVTKLPMQVVPFRVPCEAFQTSSAERLDQILASALIERMPAGGFQALQGEGGHGAEKHPKDIPTLLHFAAENGLRDLTGALLQCPGAQRALHVANRHGATPLKLAKSHGHAHVYSLLQEALVGSSMGEDNTIYEMMGSPGQGNTNNSPGEEENNDVKDEDDEDPYTAVGGDDEEYDTILASNKAATITNRPPAPTPRPEATPTKKDDIPFIAQVFQKKMSQGAADNLYSQSSRQGRGQKSIGSAYDTFVPYQPPGLEELIELQEKVKKGTLTMDEALERFSDWQQVQKGLDDIQQEKLRQLRASIINNREDDENVYDKINIVHHTPDVDVAKCRRGTHPTESGFYSKPLKGQQVSVG